MMGARDAFGAEVESNFADKVLGHADSLHIIKLPEGAGEIFGLAAKTCEPASASTPALTSDQIGPLMKQVVGWKEVLDGEGRNALQFTWDVRDEAAGQMLVDRIRPKWNVTSAQPSKVGLLAGAELSRTPTMSCGSPNFRCSPPRE